MSGEDKIILYPSNWLYNIGVIGFLKVVESAEGSDIIKDIKDWLQDDGTVTIDRNIFSPIEIKNHKLPKCIKILSEYLVSNTEIVEWLNKTDKSGKKYQDKYKAFYEKMGDFGYKYIYAGNKLFASNRPYQNLVQLSEWQSFELTNIVKSLATYREKQSNLTCCLCGSNSAKEPNTNSKLEKRLFLFQEPHMRALAPSKGEFPNAFWNLKDSLIICPLCAYLTIHRHIAWINTQNEQIFINAPSFKVMWYLNKFAEKLLTKSKEYELRKILALSLMEFAQKVSVTLGAWSIMNIEMIIKKSKRIDYYCLPYEISKVLLQRDIATLISETKEPIVLETVLNGKFDYLLTLNHKILRSLTSGSDTTEDNSLSELINKDASNLRSLSRILPELYAKIDYTIKKG